jgi:hypothetical protein
MRIFFFLMFRIRHLDFLKPGDSVALQQASAWHPSSTGTAVFFWKSRLPYVWLQNIDQARFGNSLDLVLRGIWGQWEVEEGGVERRDGKPTGAAVKTS